MPEKRRVSDLKPHPLNSKLYAPPGGPEFEEFKRSFAELGQLVPLRITADGMILSGHRRWMAAQAIGLAELDCEIEPETDPVKLERLIIEHNRYRRKTYTEIMREARKLEEIEAIYANVRQGRRTDLGYEHETEPGKVRDIVAATVGVSHGTYAKMKAIWSAAERSELIKLKVDALDRGETSIDSVFRLVGQLNKEPSDFEPKVYDMWYFGGLNPKYGKPHPGSLPGDFIENIIHYWSHDGDVIADPFAGGGITVDVCRAMGRTCYASDIAPVREDIFQWDIAQGYPPYEQRPNLIFLDPPYWNMVAEEYTEESASSLDFPAFIGFLRKLAHDTANILPPGGTVAAIIMKQKFRLPEGLPFMDWPFVWYRYFAEAGLFSLDRIACPWPTSIWQAFHVEKAKEDHRILPLVGDLMIFAKPAKAEELDDG